MRMDLLPEHLKEPKKSFVEAVSAIVAAVLSGVITYYGFVVTWEAFVAGTIHEVSTLLPSAYLLLAPMPLGAACLFAECARRSVIHVKSWRRHTTQQRLSVGEADIAERVAERESGLF